MDYATDCINSLVPHGTGNAKAVMVMQMVLLIKESNFPIFVVMEDYFLQNVVP